MAVFTVSISDGTTLSNLAVSAGRGPKGDGFTGGTYDAGTGKVTFTSNDGIGFETDDLRGDLTEPGPIGSVTPSTGAFTSLSTTGDAVVGGDLTVEGTTTTVDSTTVAVGDKNIELAKDATTAAEADGGGITLNGASATITYSSANDYWALNKGLNVSGNVSLSGTVDGRDVASDGSKLDGIESGATADQTAGEIKTAYESNADTNAFTDAEQSKLSGIESGADVTDTANVTAAGALMDSELTSEASVKALDQGVATTDSPEFAGLTVDTDTLYVDSSNNRVGIGTSSPNHEVSVREVNPTLILEDSQAALTSGGVAGSILFYNNDSSTPRGARVTASIKQVAEDSFGRTSLVFGTDTSNPKSEFGDPADYSDDTIEAMRIDSSGNVGIGTSSPSELLHISSNDPVIRMEDTDTGAYHFINAQSGFGNLLISVDQDGTGSGLGGGIMRFDTNGSEAMRVDSSGNLLVGKTSNDNGGTEGIELEAGGQLNVAVDGSFSRFNRLTSDGKIILFRKDGIKVGSIGSRAGSNIFIEFTPGSAGLTGSTTGGGSILPFRNGSLEDGTIDLGASGFRFDDIYATNGTIQTSDANEKQQIASLTDAEMTAAKTISTLFKTFKWNSAVDEKGDAARTHTGVIAQEVEQAMTDAGLDAGDYAFFISTTWWETETEVPAVEADPENGVEAKDAYTRTDTYETQEEAPEGATERTRKGIRYPELLSFVGAATEQRLASIETRLTSLEA